MAKQFSLWDRYDVFYAGRKFGELMNGKFYEGHSTSPIGEIVGNQFCYNNGEDAGRIEGLTIVRTDGTVFELVPQQPA